MTSPLSRPALASLALAALATGLAPAAQAAGPSPFTASWSIATSSSAHPAAGPAITTRLATRVLTTADLGKQLQLRITPTGGATLDCTSYRLSLLAGATSSRLEPNWYLSGCWSGGVNLVASITRAMVGRTVVLDGQGMPAAGGTSFPFTGQVSIGDQVTRSSLTLTRAAAAPAPSAPAAAKPTATVKPTATPEPSAAAASGPVDLSSLPRIPWEGGAAYYAKFPDAVRGGWADPKHFPIALWWGQVSSNAEVAHDKSLGINTYVITNPDTNYHLFDDNGVSYMGPALPGQPRTDTSWVGDFLDDEVDARYSATAGQAYLDGLVKKLPDHNKIRYTNYTGMVVSWQQNNPSWSTPSKNYVNNYTDAVSLDAYWYSSPQCDWADPNGANYLTTFTKATCRDAQAYGRNVTSLRAQDATDHTLQPVYSFIEDVDAAPNGRQEHPLTPDEVKGAAMNSLIHEARGLMWFNNSFGGPCSSGNAVRTAQNDPHYACADTIAAMGEVNRQVTALAPVLNTQSRVWTFGAGVETMLKQSDGAGYLFAMPTDQGANAGAGTKTFTVPAALRGRRISVVGENRTIAMTADGTFTDAFASVNSYHIYKIA